MERFQIENLYKLNGLKDYRLKTTGDLLKVHGINFKDVKGYNKLDDLNKAIYEKFIVNLFNGFGLESRATMIPLGIYWVEHNEHSIKEDPKDDYHVVCGSTIYAIDGEGNKELHRKWIDEDYKDSPILKTKTSEYLRFEYNHNGRNEWLHVINDGKEWY